jgi:hypothetical protein
LLNKKWENPHRLYAGVPAVEVKTLSVDDKYFNRNSGFVF